MKLRCFIFGEDCSDSGGDSEPKTRLSTALLLLSSFVFVGLTAEPALASWWNTRAADDPFHVFVDFESRYNSINQDTALYRILTQAAGDFSTSPFAVKHIEIPLDDPRLPALARFTDWFSAAAAAHGPSWLVVDNGRDLPEYIRQAFFFERSGRRFLRWPQYPGDTTFGPQLRKYLTDRGVPFSEGEYFLGRKTASRSLILTDPLTRRSFSYKTSTDRTSQGQGGSQFRPVPIRWAHLTRRLSDSFHAQSHRLKHILVASEPLAVGLPELDTAFQVRLMEPMNSVLEDGRPARYQISGLAIENRQGWKALLRRSVLSEDEMADRLMHAYVGAIAELQFVLGLRITSAHGQNIRFEFDHEFKPTGRAVILDFQDASPIADVFLARGEGQILRDWARFVLNTNRIHIISTEAQNALKNDPGIVDAVKNLADGDAIWSTPRDADRILSQKLVAQSEVFQTGFLDLPDTSHPLAKRLSNAILMRQTLIDVIGSRLWELGLPRSLLRPRMGQGAWVASQGFKILKPESLIPALQQAPVRSSRLSGWRCLDLMAETRWTREAQFN